MIEERKPMNLIVDLQLRTEHTERLKSLGFRLLHPKLMSIGIAEWSGWHTLCPNTTLLVFPGDGGQKVKDTLPKGWLREWPRNTSAFAKRFWRPGVDPFAIAHSFLKAVDISISDVVIIDDVVSSGSTAKRIKEVNSPWLPRAKWHLVVWAAQKSTKLKGFELVFATESIGTKDSKAPINSVSTLLHEPELARVYAERNIGHRSNEFLNLMLEITLPEIPPIPRSNFGVAYY